MISSVKDFAAPATKETVRPGMVLVALNDRVVEGLSLEDLYPLLKSANPPYTLTLRDPERFFDRLTRPVPADGETLYTTLQSALVAPASVPQVLAVQRLPPPLRQPKTSDSASAAAAVTATTATTAAAAAAVAAVGATAQAGSTVEIIFQARLVPNPAAVEGGPPQQQKPIVIGGLREGEADAKLASSSYRDVYADSLFFVLGSPKKQGKYTFFGAGSSDSTSGDGGGASSSSSSSSGGGGDVLELLPTSWDSLLTGMAVDERRILTLPPCMLTDRSRALLSAKAPVAAAGGQRNNAAAEASSTRKSAAYVLQLEVRLLSINGSA